MSNQYLYLENDGAMIDGLLPVLMIGIKEVRISGQDMWIVALRAIKNDPDQIAAEETKLVNAGYRMILDLQPTEVICLRVEYRALRCRGKLPDGVNKNSPDVKIPPKNLTANQTEDMRPLHDGFHLVCECGTEWKSCGHDPPSQCCD